MSDGILHIKPEEIAPRHRDGHRGYEHFKHEIVGGRGQSAEQCAISLYKIPPGNSAYPYHYHVKNEEVFYIISGVGILKTPDGERTVVAGDLLFFPANEKGAHKLTNTSESEMLVYLDFDTRNDLDVSFYPDSGKIGIWGKNTNQLYKTEQRVDYYRDE